MASSSSISTFFLAFALVIAFASAKPVNLTEILVRGSQYTTLIRLLDETQAGTQIYNQLNNSQDGFTVFAPTDNAFTKLKPGAINSLTPQQQVAFVLYHVLPKFYKLEDFQTVSNPVRTQASGNGGDFFLNITSSTQQTNLSTGVVNVPIQNALNVTKPLAVYSLDQVLLPYDLFGPKKNTTAPAPAPAGGSDGAANTTSAGKGNATAPSSSSTSTNAGTRFGGGGGWRWLAGMGFVGALVLLM